MLNLTTSSSSSADDSQGAETSTHSPHPTIPRTQRAALHHPMMPIHSINVDTAGEDIHRLSMSTPTPASELERRQVSRLYETGGGRPLASLQHLDVDPGGLTPSSPSSSTSWEPMPSNNNSNHNRRRPQASRRGSTHSHSSAASSSHAPGPPHPPPAHSGHTPPSPYPYSPDSAAYYAYGTHYPGLQQPPTGHTHTHPFSPPHHYPPYAYDPATQTTYVATYPSPFRPGETHQAPYGAYHHQPSPPPLPPPPPVNSGTGSSSCPTTHAHPHAYPHAQNTAPGHGGAYTHQQHQHQGLRFVPSPYGTPPGGPHTYTSAASSMNVNVGVGISAGPAQLFGGPYAGYGGVGHGHGHGHGDGGQPQPQPQPQQAQGGWWYVPSEHGGFYQPIQQQQPQPQHHYAAAHHQLQQHTQHPQQSVSSSHTPVPTHLVPIPLADAASMTSSPATSSPASHSHPPLPQQHQPPPEPQHHPPRNERPRPSPHPAEGYERRMRTPDGGGKGKKSHHPNPPAFRSEWVMWVGNVPSDSTHDELWQFFTRPEEVADQNDRGEGTSGGKPGAGSLRLDAVRGDDFVHPDQRAPTSGLNSAAAVPNNLLNAENMASSPHSVPPGPLSMPPYHTPSYGPTGRSDLPAPTRNGVISIFLISRSSCAFVNLASEEQLDAAIFSFNGLSLRPHDPRVPKLVCRVRRREDDMRAGVGGQRGIGLHAKWLKEQQAMTRQDAAEPQRPRTISATSDTTTDESGEAAVASTSTNSPTAHLTRQSSRVSQLSSLSGYSTSSAHSQGPSQASHTSSAFSGPPGSHSTSSRRSVDGRPPPRSPRSVRSGASGGVSGTRMTLGEYGGGGGNFGPGGAGSLPGVEGGAGAGGGTSGTMMMGSGSTGSYASTNSSFLERYFPKRYFILKSLTQYDLDLSVTKGLWATQKHNEGVLDKAFRTSHDVYLIFGVNKSGEFYGCARMAGPIHKGEERVPWASRPPEASGSALSPRSLSFDANAAADESNESPSALLRHSPRSFGSLDPETGRHPEPSPQQFISLPADSSYFTPSAEHVVTESPLPAESRGGTEQNPMSKPDATLEPVNHTHDSRTKRGSAPAALGPHRQLTASTLSAGLSLDGWKNDVVAKMSGQPGIPGVAVDENFKLEIPEKAKHRGEGHESGGSDESEEWREMALSHDDPDISGNGSRTILKSVAEEMGDADEDDFLPTAIGTGLERAISVPALHPLENDVAAPEMSRKKDGGVFAAAALDRPAGEWGESFRIEWIKTERLPFHRTKHLRNPWNHDREVKVSRDGTELEPTVGEALLREWDRFSAEVAGKQPAADGEGPSEGGGGGGGGGGRRRRGRGTND